MQECRTSKNAEQAFFAEQSRMQNKQEYRGTLVLRWAEANLGDPHRRNIKFGEGMNYLVS